MTGAEPTVLDFDALRPRSPFATAAHEAWRRQVRGFVEAEIAPNLESWESASEIPLELYRKAAAAGLLGMGFPQALGGAGETVDLYHRMIFAEEFFRLGSGVVFAELATHWIALPPVIAFGSAAILERVAKPVLAGTRKIAFAVTEPSGGSDVGALQTSGQRAEGHYRVSGVKTLISGGVRADYLLVAVRTGGPGIGGLSLLLIDANSPGIRRSPVRGLTWYNRNLGEIVFDDVRVPLENLIGPENRGFQGLAPQFNIERFSGIAATLALARVCVAEAVAWSRSRQTFGERLIDHQVIRHKIVEMIRRVNAAYGYLDTLVWRFGSGEKPVADLALLKIEATATLEGCARDALQVLGGEAWRGTSRVERIHREARLFIIGGGPDEVLRDLVARQLKF